MAFEIKIHKTPIATYAKRLGENKPFSFVRYGNGEWDGILGTRNRTGSGSQRLNIPGLRQGLQNSLKCGHDPSRYLVGMQGYAQRIPYMRKGSRQWLQINAPNLVWHDADVFHHSSARAQLWPLVEELRKKPLVFIGPPFLKKIAKRLPYIGFAEVRLRNCYQDMYQILAVILKQKSPAVFCFSAGPTTKLLISKLFPILGEESFLIDFGSLWDIYCGVSSRSYHKKITSAITRKNFGES